MDLNEIKKDYLSFIIQIINNYLYLEGFKKVEIGQSLSKLTFTLPKGLKSKEISNKGNYPVISQSKDYIIGYSDQKDLLITKDLPLIIFGDHSKTIKYIDKPFIIGADGVKILKPNNLFNEKFFYYSLFGVITDTKSYGRHYSLLKKGFLPLIDIQLQLEIVTLLDDLNYQSKNIIVNDISKIVKNILLHLITIKDIFFELNNQLEIINDLRQAFLQEAIQGKLVSNETSDEKTGADLLTEIQVEKLQLIKEKKLKKGKLTKNSKFVSKLQLPENWIYTKLDQLFFVTKLAGFEYTDHMKLTKNGDIPVIRAQNVRNLNINKNNLLYIDFDTSQLLDRCSLNKECLLITFIGAGIGDVASFQEKSRWHLAPNVAKAEPFENVEKLYNIKYFNYFLISNYGRTEIKKHMKATAQPSLSMETIRDIDLPLPPFEVQERIVSKLDLLMQYCDDLENSVKESQQYNEMLLQQVLREALEGKEESKPQLKINKTCDNNDTAILASYIIQELHTPDFGRTKLQKILHLAEYHCRLETPLQYYKKTAGPYSKNLENDIENLLRRNKLYDSKKEELKNSDKSKVNYIPLSGAKQINSFFTTEFKDQKENIDNLLKKFNDKPMEFCEMISTMYAVWNNRLIKGEIIDDEELKKDFLAWDAQKIKFLDKLDYSIEWIKKEGLVPTGFGKYIDKQ
ncbi:hypothetical protein FE904_16910 [Chryseobacterium indologenes]|uniref:restriction endonuclease subunit S n=1 Tax=Chryseobacterium indologenes TaxID=253 RepID=UPI00110925EA|nr:restriction endonuclease subunit S [Chryseobacterium indologenes]TLX24349.1 hypothetical protein FE904_16910 [Chryseobacterium indologenes]